MGKKLAATLWVIAVTIALGTSPGSVEAAAPPPPPAGEPTFQLRIVAKVPAFTPAGARIFATGSVPALCSWRPDCVELSRIAPYTFAIELRVPTAQIAGGGFEMKITRGSWATVPADAGLRALPNFKVPVGGPVAEAVINVPNWTDSRPLGVTGQLTVFPDVYSPQLGNHRRVLVWLPPEYAAHPERRYPVVYMHDGQNLFDPATSTTGVDWGIDETLTSMSARGLTPGAIVVGVDSTKDRFPEYDYLVRGNLYARFLIDTVKPEIDRRYRTLPGRDTTFTAGSSMGGLISMALVWKHPDVFSRAAALSLPVFLDDFAAYKIVESSPKPSLPIRLYMDHGTYGMDAVYGQNSQPFFRRLHELGMTDAELKYLVFEWADHTETDWARRVEVPLNWLLLGTIPVPPPALRGFVRR